MPGKKQLNRRIEEFPNIGSQQLAYRADTEDMVNYCRITNLNTIGKILDCNVM